MANKIDRTKGLCLLCHVKHVKIGPETAELMLSVGMSQEEIDRANDAIEHNTEVHPIPTMRSRVPGIMESIGGTGMFSEAELAEFQGTLEKAYPKEQDDPESPGYIPEVFKQGSEDPAVAQAKKEVAERARKERFAAKHPSKNAEYVRKHREKKKKPE